MPQAAIADDRQLIRPVDHIAGTLRPDAIYLLGLRARGHAHVDSDYDVLVVVSDETPSQRLRAERTYQLSRHVPVPADIVTCRKSAFDRWRDAVGTLIYEASHHGIRVYGG